MSEPSETDRPYRHILVPTDGSAVSSDAVAEALSLAKLSGGTVHALFVLDPSVVTGGPLEDLAIDTGFEAVFKQLEHEGEQVLDELRRAAETEHIEITTEVREGTPSVQIVKYADELGADIIVMGTHGRSGVRRALLGSTAEHVLRKASMPVMTVRKR